MKRSRKDDHDGEGASSTAAIKVVAERMGRARGYEVSGLDGVRVVVTIQDSGQRDVVLLTEEDAEPVLTLALTAPQALALATVLADTFESGPAQSSGGRYG